MNEEIDGNEVSELSPAGPSSHLTTGNAPTVNSGNIMERMWGMHPAMIQVAQEASQVYKIKHGMFAGVPIICKGPDCPFAEVCIINPAFRIVGQRCPMEAGAVIARYESWCRHFEIDITGEAILDEDLVDASLIRDLVENEIMMLRAENLVAINAGFISKTIAEIDNRGKVYYEDTVSPEAEYKNHLQEKRYKIFNLLNSTRKDRSGSGGAMNPSERAVSIFKKVAELMPDIDELTFDGEIIEMEPDENLGPTKGEE